MSLSFQQGNLEEDRDKRRKFLSMVRNELKISQDELQQNRASLHSSFESKRNRHRDSPSQMESFSQKLKPPKSPWQGNSSEKITHKLKEFQSAGIKSQYRDTYDEMQDRILQENDRVNLDNLKSPQYPTNLENTLELSRIDEIWAFGGSSKMSTQNFTPYKKTSAKSPSVMNGEVTNGAITQKEHKMRLDKELVSLETRMIEFFEKEKKTILKENMSQITKMESKMKEKYNSVVKDILETKSRGSSFSTERLSHDSQNRQTRSNSPQKETEELSEKKSPTTATNTKSSFRNCNSGQRDRFLVKSPEEFAQAMKEIKLHLSYDQDNGDYIDVTNENKNTMPNQPEETLKAEIENKNEKISEMAEKIKDLEAENETLRKRVTLMEYLFKSDAEKKSPRNESSEKLNYDKFITPKMRDYVSRMTTPTKQLDQEKQQFSNVEKKDEFVVKDFSLDIAAKNDNDTLVTELQEQIRNLNRKITALEKINKSLIEKDFNSKNKELAVREYEKQGLEEKSNQSVEDQVRFWKERCGALTTKYFEVIRKLKSDNENLKEELLLEHKTVKKATVKDLNLIQQAYQEKVTLLNTRLKHIEMQNKAYNNKHPRSSSSKGKEYY